MNRILNPYEDMPKAPTTWAQCGVGPIRPRETDGKQYLDLDVVGVRTDGAMFTITTTIDAAEMDKAERGAIIMAMHAHLQVAFTRLHTYRSCDCTPGAEITCRLHSGNTQQPTEPTPEVSIH